MPQIRKLTISDFDGTIVFTPHKTTEIDGISAIERYDRWLVEGKKPKRRWSGWWGRTETLMPPIFGDYTDGKFTPPASLLNESLASILRDASEEEGHRLVLMTGRHVGMINKEIGVHAVQSILDGYGLKFDEYYYFPGGQHRDTLSWKIDEIKRLKEEYTPEILDIHEDRPGHAYAFLREFKEANIWVVNQETRESYPIR